MDMMEKIRLRRHQKMLEKLTGDFADHLEKHKREDEIARQNKLAVSSVIYAGESSTYRPDYYQEKQPSSGCEG